MSYTTEDFSESLRRVDEFDKKHITRVLAGWGHGTGMGTDTGHGWSTESASDWQGGWLLEMNDGRFVYLSGWCDYTGWGCQDGVNVQWFDSRPDLESLRAKGDDWPQLEAWDIEPADLNRFIASEASK